MTGRFPFIKEWIAFCNSRKSKKAIPKDTWDMLLVFHETTRGDLAKYDPNGAWPLMIDEFMEEREANKNQ